MATLNPTFMTALCRTAQEDRIVFADLICDGGVAGLDLGALEVSTGSGSGLNVTVAAGGAFIFGEELTGPQPQGVYHGFNDADLIVPITAAASDPRVDQIIARIYDADYSGALNAFSIESLDGAPTSGANLTNLNGQATLPDNSIRLAYVLVPTTATVPSDLTFLDGRENYKLCNEAIDATTPNVQIFNSGSSNWTKPAGAKKVRVRMTGGGGAGGGTPTTDGTHFAAGQGGGGGGYIEHWFDADDLGATEPYAVGAGGTGVTGTTGNDGADSTFSSGANLMTAKKGSGGASMAAATAILPSSQAGAGGTGSSGPSTSFAVVGGRGSLGVGYSTAIVAPGGGGGNLLCPPTPPARASASGAGATGLSNGGGGGGAAAIASSLTTLAGGAGGNGVIIIETFFE